MANLVRLNSRTLEGQFFELMHLLYEMQHRIELNPEGIQYVSKVFDPGEMVVRGTYEFPVVEKIDNFGNLVYSPEPILNPLEQEV